MEYNIDDLIQVIYDNAYGKYIAGLTKNQTVENLTKYEEMCNKIKDVAPELLEDFKVFWFECDKNNCEESSIYFNEGFKAGVNFIVDCRKKTTE